MTEPLTVTTTPRDDNQLDLSIQLGPERTEEALQRAAKQVAKRANIPGFRRGKAPYAAVLRAFGREALLNEVLDDLGQAVYSEALESEQLEPYAQAALVDVDMDPLTFKLRVPLPPKVHLNDYRTIRVEVPEVNVTEADVEELIEARRTEKATWEEVDRPAEMGDTVVVDIKGMVGEDSIMDNQDWELRLREESGWLPGFDDAFVGMKPGEEKDFTLRYPEDSASRYKGQEANFHATVKVVKTQVKPELDDEFAKSLGDFEGVADMRAKLLERLTEQRKREAENKLHESAIQALIDKAELSYPPVVVDEVLQQMLGDMERRLSEVGYKLEDYLRLQGTTVAAYAEMMRPQAEQRAKARLVLAELARAEQIAVSDEDIQAEIDRILEVQGEGAEESEAATNLRALFASEQGRQVIQQDVRGQKTMARLRAIVTGEPLPELSAEDAETAAAAPEAAEPAAENEEVQEEGEPTAEASSET